MAVVQGVKEKVHLPLYDSIFVKPEEQLRKDQGSSTLKFFVDVQGKTKLETNMQSASQLSHYNTFEARAMRVVISDLPPEFPDEPETFEDQDVTDEDDNRIDAAGNIENVTKDDNGNLAFVEANAVTADIELGLFSLVELLKEAHDSEGGVVEIPLGDDAVVKLKKPNGQELTPAEKDLVVAAGAVFLSTFAVESLIEDLERDAPPREQFLPNNGAGSLLSKFIYNTVTTFFVGEKIMIECPTWMFPAGAGAFSDQSATTTHGTPDPTATFRFAEPVHIDRQQNFRVEIEVPDSDVLKEIQKIYGPFTVWVLLDGYTTRDVQ